MLEETWGTFRRHWRVLVLCELLHAAFVACLVLAGTALWTFFDDILTGWILLEVGFPFAVTLLVTPPVALFKLGLYRIALRAARGESPRVLDLFGELRLLPGGILADGLFTTGVRAASLACLVPGLMFGTAYCLTTPFLVDRELRPVAALQASGAATRGNRWNVLRLLLACGFFYVAGLLACMVGLLVAAPLVRLVLVHTSLILARDLARCPLCQTSIPADSERCPGCDEWEPLLDGPFLRCPACAERAPREEQACPYCCSPLPPGEAASAPAPRWAIHVPARTPPRWLTGLALLLMFPALAWGDSLRDAVQTTRGVLQHLGAFPPWLAASILIGAVGLPTLAAFLVLAYQHLASRAADADPRQATFGRAPRWHGVEVPWERVEGFRVSGGGVTLRLKDDRLSRWFGPTLRTEGRQTHDLVVRLEELGIPRLEE